LQNAAHSFDIWTKIAWSDIIIHMFTTFAVTLFLASYLSHLVRASSRRRLIILLVVLTSLGFSLGGVWEMLEWTVPEKTNGEGRTDVVSDLLCDLIGALAAASVATFMANRRRH
jgi:VanZ family protein